MNLREEMLEQAGVNLYKNIVSDLIVGGLFFNENLNRDLTRAVSGRYITLSESNKLKKMSQNSLDYFFQELLPKVKNKLEADIFLAEDRLENASVLEEGEDLVGKLDILRERYNKIKDL